MHRLFGTSLVAATAILALPASAQVTQNGNVVSITLPERSSAATFNYVNSQARRLPQAIVAPGTRTRTTASPYLGPPKIYPGGIGNGIQTPVQLHPPVPEKTSSGDGRAPQEYGTTNHVFTTSRVNAYNQPTATFQPFATAGKLFMQFGSSSFVCSASLVKPGLVVTAAHCVSDFGLGTSGTATAVQYVPGYNNGAAPYGTWNAKRLYVPASYLNGSDTCDASAPGVVCQNDVAIIELQTPNGLLGTQTGWFAVGVDGAGFNMQSPKLALISQLGYPVALDEGKFMERTDSQGFVSAADVNNTVIGSLQTGGSSGGPWIVNLGRPPILDGTTFGSQAMHNVVVGVTSWGYVSSGPKEMGASPFLSTNVTALINAACTAAPGKC